MSIDFGKLLRRSRPASFFLLTYIFIALFVRILIKDEIQKFRERDLKDYRNYNIRISFIACTENLDNLEDSVESNEALTLIKSVLISAKLHKVSEIFFYIFTDSSQLENLLRKRISDYNALFQGSIRIQVSFYCVFKTVSHKYVNDFIIKPKLRCGSVRLFFPEVLPDVDEILYLDTDEIITGNIAYIWSSFRNIHGQQLAGLVPNNEPEDKRYSIIDKATFADLPRVPPKGVNSGVMFMNLREMRKNNWTRAMLQLYHVNRKRPIYMSDQRLINIYFHDYPARLKLFPCKFNFQHLHCERGLTCKSASSGIQIIHGAGGKFENNSGPIVHIFNAYRDFDLHRFEDVLPKLIRPLKRYYTDIKNKSTCNGRIGSFLFTNLEDQGKADI